MRLICWIFAVCLALSGCPAANAQTPAPAPLDLAVAGSPPEAAAFLVAARSAGTNIVAADTLLAGAPGILVYGAEPKTGPAQPEKLCAGIERLLQAGGTLIVHLPHADPALKAMERFLPVNGWTFGRDDEKRSDTGAVAPPGSEFAECLKTPGLLLPDRYDLHLPYSTMEGGQDRYEPARLGKELLNTDWRVLLTCDTDGRLPLLVEGRYGAGRVFIFGGSLTAGPLERWQGYPDFIKTLLAAATPQPVAPSADEAAALRLEVPPAQPSGPLRLRVSNPSGRPVSAVLFCKVRNIVGELMNSCSHPVAIPAGGTVDVPLPEVSPEIHAEVVARSADAATAFRRVEAGLSGPDRRRIAVTASGVVDRTPALTLRIQGEDARQFPKTDGWPAGGIDFSGGDSIPVERFVYFCGDQPRVTVHLANALHNIATLAKAVDVSWPANPSTPGLNDLCYCYDNVLNGLEPTWALTGYWAGRNGQATQQLRLDWPLPVTLTSQRLSAQSSFRQRDLSNPRDYTLTAALADGPARSLAEVRSTVYTLCQRTDTFPPAAATSCLLTVSGLDPKAAREPNPLRALPDGSNLDTNCALDEWEVNGWPGTALPPAVRGTLRVTLHDLSDGTATVLAQKDTELAPLTEQTLEVALPARARFGEVRVTAEFFPAGGAPLRADHPLLMVPAGRGHLTPRDTLGDAQDGLLCSPGFVHLDPFGKGTYEDTQGWGGPDDKVWAWSHDLMEIGKDRQERADRFYLSAVGLTHYTDPWRDFGSGRDVWDWATDCLLEKFRTGEWKNKKSVHIVLSDRWNGVPVNASFAWADFIAFDAALRAGGKSGLHGRTRVQLTKEVTAEHADEFQRFELQRYADALDRSQARLAAQGHGFSTETHGSFPLVGGKLGEEMGRTDKAVGTDLFWEMRDEDLYKSIGYRFGLVAANPDFESGAYDQWGWISGVQANPSWHAPSGDVEPSRRQWYATYWAGRITSDGAFKPYTIYGFSLQGGFGVKNLLEDWRQFNRVQSTMVWVRPERATGCGIVASWPLQESRLSPDAGQLGFGLYAGHGNGQINELTGELYNRLMRHGVPISFVASTDTLRNCRDARPLILVDGFEYNAAEIEEMQRFNRLGAPIIAVGNRQRAGHPASEAFFGVAAGDDGWTPHAGTEIVKDAAGAPFAYVRRRGGGGAATVFCPKPIGSMDSVHSALLAGLVLEAMGHPLTVSPGFAASTFSSNGSLFVLLGNQGDNAQTVSVTVKPALLDPMMQGNDFRVVDLDDAIPLPARSVDGALQFAVPCGSNDGRMIQILPVAAGSAAR